MREAIENWARNRPFEVLTESEKALVCSEMSSEEYDDMYRALRVAPRLHGDAVVPPVLQGALLQRLRATPRIPWWQCPVPLWAAASLLPVVAVACFLAGTPRDTAPLEPTVVQVLVHDTLVLRDTVRLTRMVIRRTTVAEPLPTEPIASLPSPVSADFLRPLPLFFADTSTLGTSLSECPELMDFFVQPEGK
jgi:hypothetical protein